MYVKYAHFNMNILYHKLIYKINKKTEIIKKEVLFKTPLFGNLNFNILSQNIKFSSYFTYESCISVNKTFVIKMRKFHPIQKNRLFHHRLTIHRLFLIQSK